MLDIDLQRPTYSRRGYHSYLHVFRASEVRGKALEMPRRLGNQAALQRQTAAYFEGFASKASAEETDLEDALSAASQEIDFDRP